ncbi:MAG: glycerate kinase family protein [Marmoricola sp.]
MRVVIAPDKFAGTLTAVEAAEAIARGWRRRAPADECVAVPMSDGGPGFVDVLHAALGGELVATTVPDPYGAPVPATLLRVGETAYIEAAQAVGLQLTAPEDRRPGRASSAGAGRLVAAALETGAERIVLGLGGSATNDGGAGLLAALGATCSGGSLLQGPDGLEGVGAVDLAEARQRVAGVSVVAATDVENPLLGLLGATKIFGPQKGIPEELLLDVDGRLQRLAELTDRRLADAKGAGAAGGLGFALLLLGATRRSGVEMVADAVGLGEVMRGADLAITGEGAFDFSSRAGKVVHGVAQRAEAALLACVVLAGRVDVGAREMRAMGVESAYSMSELLGPERSLASPGQALGDLAERVARTWSR